MLTRSTVVSFSLFCLVAFGWLAGLLYAGGAFPSLGGGPYKVSVLLPTSASLTAGSRVTMAGVNVGTIKAVERQGLGARADLELDDDATIPLPSDSRVSLRQHTAIGENYISIVPGTSRQTLESGAVMKMDQAEEYVDVDQVLSVLRGQTRERARQTIQGMGGALADRGEALNEVVAEANEFAPHGGRFVEIAHRDREEAARLVEQLGDLATAVGDRGTAIRTIARRGLVGLDAIRDRDTALAASLRELPGTLVEVRELVGTVGDVSDRATPVATNLAAAVRELEPAVGNLPAATAAGRIAFTELNTAAPILTDTLRRATALSQALPPVLPELRNVLCQVDPMAKYLAPYSDEGVHIIMGLGSASNSYDGTGHLVRLAPILSDNSPSGLPDDVVEARNTLLRSGLLGESNGQTFDPYPAPGSLGTTVGSGTVPLGPDQVPETGYKYPRIQPSC